MKIDQNDQIKMLDDNIDSVIEAVIASRLKVVNEDTVDYNVSLKRLSIISKMTDLIFRKIKSFGKLYFSGRTVLNRKEIENFIGRIERYYLVRGDYETYVNSRPIDRHFFSVTPELKERVLAVLREELIILAKKQKEDLAIVTLNGTGFDIRRSILQKRLARLNKSTKPYMQ